MSICARQERFCFRKDKSDKHQKIRPLPYTIERCTIRYTEEEEKKEEKEEDEEEEEDDDDDDDGDDDDGGDVVIVMMMTMI